MKFLRWLVALAALSFSAPALAVVPINTVGGYIVTQTIAPPVTASSAYASGNAVGTLMLMPTATRETGGSALVQSALVYSKSAQTAQVDLFLFKSNPTASTCADKTAFSLAAADFDKVVGVIHVTDWTSAGTPSVGQGQTQALPFALASGTAMYACAVTRGTPTFSSTSDVEFAFNIIWN